MLLALPLMGAERRYVGMSQSGKPIEAFVVPADFPGMDTVLLIGGLAGDDATRAAVNREIQDFEATAIRYRPYTLLAIPLANPDRSKLVFPPAGVAYRENAESHALWRWIALQAPDVVRIAGVQDSGLAAALSANVVAGVGRIPAVIVPPETGMLKFSPSIIVMSQARAEINRRKARTPRQLADELAQYYGHDFDQLTYIPGMALIGQMRLGNVAEVQRLAAPYLDPSKNILARASSLTLAGHLVFAELATRTGDARYVELVRKAADLGFTETGEMKESMPFHDEMSDSFFMATPIVSQAGKLTGERKYFDLAARHFDFMQKLDLRPDGIYRHSPLTDAAWGRGNAFPALGMALTLFDFPKDHPAYTRILQAFQHHMAALARFQDEDGMWHEVIDEPASYAETSATSMIAFSIARGIRRGWLDAATYQPRLDRAWQAVLARIGHEGRLIDVCESTNKQSSLDAYLKRAASLDKDPRGGAMALLLATEMAGLP
jgi:unsaturated rhamnogalacturonyl hydrolase